MTTIKRYDPTVFRTRMRDLDVKKRWFLLVPIDAIERGEHLNMTLHIQNKQIDLHLLSTIDVIDEDSLYQLYEDLHHS